MFDLNLILTTVAQAQETTQILDISRPLAGAGALLIIGALSNKLSSRFNVPILILFLLLGGLLGYRYTPGDTHYTFINMFGTVAMSFILFSGGMDTRFRTIKGVLIPGGILATVGVLITALLMSFGTLLIVGEKLAVSGETVSQGKLFCIALLLGAMVSSTDAAAVFAILSGKKTGLKGKLKPLLEFESGSNDPMAFFLTTLTVDILLNKNAFTALTILELFYRMAAGIFAGWLIGRLSKKLYDIKLEHEGLYFVFNVAIVFFTYGVSDLINANGMMACYVCGMTMTHYRFNYQKSITRFSDGVSWLMQVALFTTLGLFINVQELPKIAGIGILLAFFLMFIARPASVFITLIFTEFKKKEIFFISWVGLRGAAPIVLATFPLAAFPDNAGNPAAQLLFNLVFIIVIMSLVIQGITMMPLAKKLKLDKFIDDRERSPLELEQTAFTKDNTMFEFEVKDDSPVAGKCLAELQISSDLLVSMIRRKNRIIQPRGATVIESGDSLTVMGNFEALTDFAKHHKFEDELLELQAITEEKRRIAQFDQVLSSIPAKVRFFGGPRK